MEVDNREEMEEEIYSKTRQNEFKIKEFKEYLVSHDVLLAYVKCIFFKKNKQNNFLSFGFTAKC